MISTAHHVHRAMAAEPPYRHQSVDCACALVRVAVVDTNAECYEQSQLRLQFL